MRVLLVTPSYFPIVGGSEVLTHVLSEKLNKIGIDADIMTFNMDKKWNPRVKGKLVKDGAATVFKEGAFNLIPGLRNSIFSLFRMNALPRPGFVKKYKDYDIIHFIGEADLSLPLFSSFVKKPKLLQCVGIFKKGGIYKYYASDRVFLGQFFKKFFPRVADSFIISSSEEKDLLAALGVPEKKIAVLPLAVDTEIFSPDSHKKKERLLLFVGRIDPIKGLHLLLQALQYIEIPLKVVVIGPPWDIEYTREIENMANAINQAGLHSVILVGELSSTDLVPWYQKASILVCPYLYETHSNVVREALSCGTPVVSTGSNLVEDCSDGIMISQQNPKDLATTINKLLDKPGVCEELGKLGRNTIEQYFSWDFVIEELLALYEDTLKPYSHS